MSVRAVVSSLRIKPGLRGSSKRIEGPWRVGFFYDREAKQYAIDLYYGERSQRMGLSENDVETRGRSNWITDNTWRLTTSGIDKVTSQIEGAIERTARYAAERKAAR